MESATKNKKNFQQLSKMVLQTLSVNLLEAEELTEGYCNAAYKLRLADGRAAIIKIAPSSEDNLLQYEKGMMQSEVAAMRLAQTNTEIPVAQVYVANDQCTLCDSPFFIMECLSGESLAKIKSHLDSIVLQKLYFDLGRILKSLHQIHGKHYGLLSGLFCTSDWFSSFFQMMEALLQNAQTQKISLGREPACILAYLQTRKAIFMEVNTPCLIHWDTWDGNLLIQNNDIVGIIDWERALWGDPLMEYNFRSFTWNTNFLRGYGIEHFSEQQKERILWYDIYLNLILYIEAFYRKYPNRQGAQHAYTRFQTIMETMGL